MDRPAADVLLKVVRVSSWHKANAYLTTLAETLPMGSEQRAAFEDAHRQFKEHIQENNLDV